VIDPLEVLLRCATKNGDQSRAIDRLFDLVAPGMVNAGIVFPFLELLFGMEN
jgi:hypothetical protein